MSSVTTKDGTEIFYQDWGDGPPVVFSHGWPLTSDAFAQQMFFLASHGYRCVAHDRRGHGRSSPSWSGHDLDTYADDLATLVDALDIEGATLVGHSIGSGEILRYVGRYGTKRTARLVLISAIAPRTRLPSSAAPAQRAEVFDRLRGTLLHDRPHLWRELSLPFYGFNRAGITASAGVRDAFWLQAMSCGLPGAYFSIELLQDADVSRDLQAIDVPTLILHGDDDQLVPAESARVYARLIKNSTLQILSGAPHGLVHHARGAHQRIVAGLSGDAVLMRHGGSPSAQRAP